MVEIELNNGQKAQIDDEDYDFVMSLKPFPLKDYKDKYFYLVGYDKGVFVRVSRCLMNAPQGTYVSYKDGNRLNLQKANLYIRHLGGEKRQPYRPHGTLKRLRAEALEGIPIAPPKPPRTPKKRGARIRCWDEASVKRREKWAKKAIVGDNIYQTKAIRDEVRRKQLAQELAESDQLKVTTFDNLADIFKDFVPDGWEPPKRDP